MWRTTGPAVRSRAAREFDALLWLGKNAPPSAAPVAVFESRRCGLLCRAVLVTRTFAGEPLDRLLQRGGDHHDLAIALGHYLGRLHALGFRDRNLDLRNLLAARRDDGGWRLTKIDSPRYRLVAAGPAHDALAAADWHRLLPQLERFALAETVRHAARDSAGG